VRHASVRDVAEPRFAAREGVSGGMRGGVGSRVGGGVAMLFKLVGEGDGDGDEDGEGCFRQPRMSVNNEG
jgi:hypothetical protein